MPPKLSRVSDVRLPEKVKKEFKKLCEAFDMSPDDVSAGVERVKEHVNKPIIDGKTPLFCAVESAAQDLSLAQVIYHCVCVWVCVCGCVRARAVCFLGVYAFISRSSTGSFVAQRRASGRSQRPSRRHATHVRSEISPR
jgi:hypothetical protein